MGFTDPDPTWTFLQPLKKICCYGSIELFMTFLCTGISFKKIIYFFVPQIKSKDPDPGGQLIMDPDLKNTRKFKFRSLPT